MTVRPRDQVLAELQKLGLSGYEAKAYMALISADTALTGYEVAKVSGVPRSTVYEILSNLLSKGIVFLAEENGGTAGYMALPPRALIARLRRDFDDSLGSLSRNLPGLRLPVKASLSHHLSGHSVVRQRVLDMIDMAKTELYLSIWPDDLETARDRLERAQARGVDVSVICFGTAPPIGNFYEHYLSSPNIVLERVGCQLMVVSADRQAALVAGTVDQDTWAVHSEDPAFVLVAVEYVRHDIALQVLVDRVGKEQVERFWFTDPALVRLSTGKGAPGLPSSAGRKGRRGTAVRNSKLARRKL
jgi:sugar-specific transcriptional regulator TrmB